jgi:hypothetical protein
MSYLSDLTGDEDGEIAILKVIRAPGYFPHPMLIRAFVRRNRYRPGIDDQTRAAIATQGLSALASTGKRQLYWRKAVRLACEKR